MKNYEQIANEILHRRDEYEKAKQIKRKKLASIFGAVSVIVITALGIAVMHEESNESLVTPSVTQAENGVTISETQTVTQSDEGISNVGGEVSGGWFIPALPFDKEIKLTGDEITDSEACEYFDKHKDSIVSSLSASGVTSENIKISEKGYCHVTYDGTEGKSFEVRQNYRDYLMFSGEELIAIITLFKEDGVIYNTPSFGAAWFKNYNEYLNAHKGEELVFAYAGWFEIIIAPDNTYMNPMGLDVSPYSEGVENPYEMFYHKKAVYIP